MRLPSRIARPALVALFGALVAVTPGATQTSRPGLRATKTVLPDGLTVLVIENRTLPVVVVSLFVRSGTGRETDATSGISNLLQQVMVKGTASRSALALAQAAEEIGGTISTSADTDFCEIRGAALGQHWRDLLALIADVALSPSLPEDEIGAEREAVLRALRNRQDQPLPLAMETLRSRLYGAHPYARPSLGRADVVARIDREALRAHFERAYRVERMILAVSGDVDVGQVVKESERLFAAAPAARGAPDPAVPPATPTLDRTAVVRASAQSQVLIGFLAPPVSHPDYAAVKVLATVLGGGMSGRLWSELRDKQGLAYSTGVTYPTRIGPSALLAQIGTAPANAMRAEEGMRREIERIRQEPPSGAELERARAYLLGQFALDRRTNARLAWYAAFFEAVGVGHDFPARYVRMVEAVTAADVLRVAGIYLASPTIVSLGPQAQ